MTLNFRSFYAPSSCDNRLYIPSRTDIGICVCLTLDRYTESKYANFYDILSYKLSSDATTKSIHDHITLLRSSLSQAVDEMMEIIKARDEAKKQIERIACSIKQLRSEASSLSSKNFFLQDLILRKKNFLVKVEDYIERNLKTEKVCVSGYGDELLQLFSIKMRMFVLNHQSVSGILEFFPFILEIINAYSESGRETVSQSFLFKIASFESLLGELESKKQHNSIPELVKRFEENITESVSENDLYAEQVRLMKEGVTELRANIGELKRQRAYLQKGVKEIKEGLTLLTRHLDGIREFNEHTEALKVKDNQLIESVLAKSNTLEKLSTTLQAQRKDALEVVEKYRKYISDADFSAFLDADAHIANAFNVTAALEELTLGDT